MTNKCNCHMLFYLFLHVSHVDIFASTHLSIQNTSTCEKEIEYE